MTQVAKFDGDWTAEQIDAGKAGTPFEIRRQLPVMPPDNWQIKGFTFEEFATLATSELNGRIVPCAHAGSGEEREIAFPARVMAAYGHGVHPDDADPERAERQTSVLSLWFERPDVIHYEETPIDRGRVVRAVGYEQWRPAFTYMVWEPRFGRAGLCRADGGLWICVVGDGSDLAIEWAALSRAYNESGHPSDAS